MTGGIVDKIGNIYEAKGAVLGLLQVLRGKALSIQYESILPEQHGIDWIITYSDHKEFVQAKKSISHGTWTIKALNREGIFNTAGEWLAKAPNNHFTFISESPSPEIKQLCETASHAMNVTFLINALSQPQRKNFEELHDIWEESPDLSLNFLKRCIFDIQSENQLDELIQILGESIFNPTPKPILFPILRSYIEERMALELTNERIVREIEQGGELSFGPHLDPNLADKIREANQLFDISHPLFGLHNPIHRAEVNRINEELCNPEGPKLILLTGNAGSGKSFILKEVMENLGRQDIPHLAFRVDRYLSVHSLEELGHNILGINKNPLSILTAYAQSTQSVLIIDQVDAIGTTSGRSGPMHELVLSLLRNAKNIESVHVIAACRSYDLSDDPRLKEYENDKQVSTIKTSPLDWSSDVEPILQEQGFTTFRIPPAMRILLTTPLHLAIFLNLKMESESDSWLKCIDLFTLYDRLLEEKAQCFPGIEIIEVLATIARKMSDDQVLDASETILEPTVVTRLASEQLIIRSRSRISFFHETFFDYIYARDFVKGNRSIIQFLKSDEQILFRRTQVRQILNYYRQTGGRIRGKYYSELESVLNNDDVRYHIKDGVAIWLGSLSDPSERELNIILKLDMPNTGMPFLVRKAIYPQPSWALILAKRGDLDRWLRGASEARRDDATRILTTLLNIDQITTIHILKQYWNEARESRLVIILRWILFAGDIEPSESLIQFIIEVIESDIQAVIEKAPLEHLIPYKWYAKYPQAAGKIFLAFFTAWFKTHPDDHPFSHNRNNVVPEHLLEELKKSNPEVYLDTALPILTMTIQRINQINSHGMKDATLYMVNEGYDFGADGFFRNIRISLFELAKHDPQKAVHYLKSIHPRAHTAYLYLYLSTIAAGGIELSRLLESILDIPNLMNAGPSYATWLPFAKAVKANLPFLNQTVREHIEIMILRYWPELNQASHIIQQFKPEDETKFKWKIVWSDLHRSGMAQWSILKTIGVEFFSSSAKIRFEMLDRKFPGVSISEPTMSYFSVVPPPIKQDRAKHMTDEQWIQAIQVYNSDNVIQSNRRRKPWDTHSGSGGLSQVLGELTKSDIERFAKFFMKLPSDANPVYGDAILRNLADSKINIGIFIPIFKKLNSERNQGYCSGFCQIIIMNPNFATLSDVFELLLWYVEHGPINTSVGELENKRIEQDMLNIHQLLDGRGMISVLHSDRAAAVRALVRVMVDCKERRDAAIVALKARLINENAKCIRCALSESLLYMMELLADKHEAIGLLHNLIYINDIFDPYPLTNYYGIYLFHRILYLFPKECTEIIDSLLQFQDEKVKELGVYFSIYRSFISDTYSLKTSTILSIDNKYNYIDAGLAAQFISKEAYRDDATKKLIAYFNSSNDETKKWAITCFRFLKSEPLEQYHELLYAFIYSPAFLQADFSFYDFIKSAPDCSRDVVITIAEHMLELMIGNTDNTPRLDFMTIGEMLNKEYAGAIDEPDSCKRILNLIDGMLQAGMYEASQIVEEHERK